VKYIDFIAYGMDIITYVLNRMTHEKENIKYSLILMPDINIKLKYNAILLNVCRLYFMLYLPKLKTPDFSHVYVEPLIPGSECTLLPP